MSAAEARWDRIEALVAAALELPPRRRAAFLERELRREDDDVRTEVLSLVAHATDDPGFLERVSGELVSPVLDEALAELARALEEQERPRGMIAGRYRIEERSGGGGMGVVYRATDTRLDRVVALKFLPATTSRDAAARERFVREARAASALDHPNIATVYDILESPEGRDCIVMAHYEGRSLRQLLRDAPLSLPRVCELGLQVARGLHAAHARGIVHCDIKPDNVLVTDEGVAKIVDFGLARFMGGASGGAGSTRGTLPYMSPEQLRGEAVTPRTDLWSLGVSLHEMVTGWRPFAEASGTSLAAAILEEPAPPPSASRPELPGWFDDVVGRLLRKGPEARYADAAAVAEALQEGLAGSAAGTGSSLGKSFRHPAIAVTVVAVMALLGVTTLRSLDPDPWPPRFIRPRQLSAAEGVEDFAAWSPSGDAVLYQGSRGGEVFGGSPDVLLRRLDDEVPRNLTADHDGFDGHPSWSPDGSRFAFYSTRLQGGYFVRPVEGGVTRQVWRGRPLGGGHNSAAWSPDGRDLAITVDGGSSGATLEIVSVADGTVRRRLALPGRPGNLRFGTAWSPDGRFLAVADAMNLTPDEARLWVLRLEDGAALPITQGSDLAWSPTWAPDARALFFISDRGGSRDLWVQQVDANGRPRGDPREVTTGVGMRNASLSGDGSRVVYSKGRLVAHVWRVPVLEEGTAGWPDAEQVTSDRAYVEFVEVDPRDGAVFLSSDRAGNQDLWRLDDGGPGAARRLTDHEASDWAPMLSPDRRRIAYYSARSGNRDIWVRSLESGSETQVTFDESIDFVPSWSPDGSRIVFASGRRGNLDIWTVAGDGGDPRQLTTDPAMDAWPHWSPDGATIVFRSNRDGTWRLWRVPAEGGAPLPVTRVPTTYFRWSPDGRALYLVSGNQLWSHDLVTGQERRLTDFADRQGTMGVVALATDGRHLYFTWEEDVGDLWMMERVR